MCQRSRLVRSSVNLAGKRKKYRFWADNGNKQCRDYDKLSLEYELKTNYDFQVTKYTIIYLIFAVLGAYLEIANYQATNKFKNNTDFKPP